MSLKKLLKFFLASIIVFPMISLSFAQEMKSLDVAFKQSVEILNQITLPNAMGREPGFDMAAHMKKLEADWKKITKAFYNPEGIAYLKSKMQAQDVNQDNMPILAGLKILSESKQNGVNDIFKSYMISPDSVVKEWATRFYK